MDEAAKKTALRMIPYGMFVLTTRDGGQNVGAATINWATQTSFKPPLVAVGVKSDSATHQHIKDTGVFAINVIGKDQKNLAFTFFKPQQRDGNSIGGQSFELGKETGCPLLQNLPTWWECKLVGEVLEAGVRREDQSLLMRDHNLNYGG